MFINAVCLNRQLVSVLQSLDEQCASGATQVLFCQGIIMCVLLFDWGGLTTYIHQELRGVFKTKLAQGHSRILRVTLNRLKFLCLFALHLMST